MARTGLRCPTSWAVIVFLSSLVRATGGEPNTVPSAKPEDTDIVALTVYPDRLTLRSNDDQRQLIITATRRDGRLTDVTADAEFRSDDEAMARVTPGNRIVPTGDGATTVTARYGGQSVAVPVEVHSIGVSRPPNFANQIVPVFTKLGCNSGGCHGKASGQNGFRLSLLGFDTEADYAAIVQESRGRRVFPAAPDQSLLLRKAAGAMAHGGGRKLDPLSEEYALIRRWISAGAPPGRSNDPVVTHVIVYPDRRVLSRQACQQIATYAHYSDGSIEDVTRRAQYESNDTEIAAVDAGGLVRTLALSGQATVMARYQGHVATFRAVVPLGAPVPAYDFPVQSMVDVHVHRQWQALGLAPSELCSDEEFVRRLSLDLTGTLPTPARATAFAADRDPTKRARLVDDLLESPEYAYFFANQWADVLRVKRRNDQSRAPGTFAFHRWLCDVIATDKPYDEFVRELLTAAGDEIRNPPTVWYKEVQTPEQFADDVAQVFLGMRLSCAQCHHHPYEHWGQDDYWGLAAFFGRVGRKNLPVADAPQPQRPTQYLFTKPTGGMVNKRTGRPAALKPLGTAPVEVGPDEDPRQRLADWAVDPANPYFARAVANRYWAHFFGRGIVDPVDDLRVTNPPSNPELLHALAKELIDHRYSLKALTRAICTSRTYQMSAVPNALNRHDKQNFARFYPRRLGAEVLLDAVGQVTAAPSEFGGLPRDRHAPQRSIMLPDESFTSYFLDVFGRPQRTSACACERGGEASLAQALHLLNSEEVHAKIAHGGRADALARDPRSDAVKVEELFLWAYARRPTATDLTTALDHLAKHSDDKKQAYENLLWALLNTKEFLFNH